MTHVRQNNSEFAKVSRFTSLLMCSKHFILSCKMLLLAISTSNNYPFCVCLSKSPESLPGKSCLGPLGVGCFSGHCNSSELNLFGFWTSNVQELAISCRKVVQSAVEPVQSAVRLLYLIFLFMFNILYTKKMHWRMFSLGNTINYLILFLITEHYWGIGLLIYALLKFIIPDNRVRFLYFQVCSSVFPPCVHCCYVMDCVYHSQKSSDPPQLDYYVTLALKHRLPFFSGGGMPPLALLMPQALVFLSSSVSDHLILL